MDPPRGRVSSAQSLSSSRATSADASNHSLPVLRPLPRGRDMTPMTHQRQPSLDIHSSPGNLDGRVRSRSPGMTLRTASANQHYYGLQQGISPSSTPLLAPSDPPPFAPSFTSPFELQGSPTTPLPPRTGDINLSPSQSRSNSKADIFSGSRPTTPVSGPGTRSLNPTEAKPSKRKSWLPGILHGRSQSGSKPHEGSSAWLIGPPGKVEYDLIFLTSSQVG